MIDNNVRICPCGRRLVYIEKPDGLELVHAYNLIRPPCEIQVVSREDYLKSHPNEADRTDLTIWREE